MTGGGIAQEHVRAPGKVAALHDLGKVVPVDDGATGGVDQVGPLLHGHEQLLVEEPLGGVVQRAVDRHHIAPPAQCKRQVHQAETENVITIVKILHIGTIMVSEDSENIIMPP